MKSKIVRDGLDSGRIMAGAPDPVGQLLCPMTRTGSHKPQTGADICEPSKWLLNHTCSYKNNSTCILAGSGEGGSGDMEALGKRQQLGVAGDRWKAPGSAKCP